PASFTAGRPAFSRRVLVPGTESAAGHASAETENPAISSQLGRLGVSPGLAPRHGRWVHPLPVVGSRRGRPGADPARSQTHSRADRARGADAQRADAQVARDV